MSLKIVCFLRFSENVCNFWKLRLDYKFYIIGLSKSSHFHVGELLLNVIVLAKCLFNFNNFGGYFCGVILTAYYCYMGPFETFSLASATNFVTIKVLHEELLDTEHNSRWWINLRQKRFTFGTKPNAHNKYCADTQKYISTLESVDWVVILFYVISEWNAHILYYIFGWFKRSLNQSIGSFSTNPHFALFRPDQRSDTFGNVSNHWGMVTYTFFGTIFLGHQLGCAQEALQMCVQALLPYI